MVIAVRAPPEIFQSRRLWISLLDELKDEGEIDLPEAKGGETVTLVNLSRGEFKEKQLSNPTLSSFLTKRGINPTKNIVWKEKFYSGW